MYSVEVRERVMIAHSLRDPFFGPAQRLHGATYIADVAFFRAELNAQNVVADIGAALALVRRVLAPLAYRNLDLLPEFDGRMTTTEFLCRHVFEALKGAISAGALGEDGRALARLRITLQESDIARASYEGPLGG